MHQHRLFKVAPDAIHIRLSYEAYTGTWSVHTAVVERLESGDLECEPAVTYDHLSNEEAYDVVEATMSTLLDVPATS